MILLYPESAQASWAHLRAAETRWALGYARESVEHFVAGATLSGGPRCTGLREWLVGGQSGLYVVARSRLRDARACLEQVVRDDSGRSSVLSQMLLAEICGRLCDLQVASRLIANTLDSIETGEIAYGDRIRDKVRLVATKIRYWRGEPATSMHGVDFGNVVEPSWPLLAWDAAEVSLARGRVSEAKGLLSVTAKNGSVPRSTSTLQACLEVMPERDVCDALSEGKTR